MTCTRRRQENTGFRIFSVKVCYTTRPQWILVHYLPDKVGAIVLIAEMEGNGFLKITDYFGM